MERPEVIQQWQYIGQVHPKLLEDKVFEQCRAIGITALQSYVLWAEIEKEPGMVNFDTYDVLVEKLGRHGLKWVPFLILGPYYATPQWFQASEESVFARCMEHGQESKIQSIWNPYLPKYIDRFLRLVSEHYCRSDALGSIILGISGNWGEALYPATGCFYGGFHTHPGWWCGDRYVVKSFQEHIASQYTSLKDLNAAWGADFKDYSEIKMPPLKAKPGANAFLLGIARYVYKAISYLIKPLAPEIRDFIWIKKECLKSNAHMINEKQHRQWMDFVQWYVTSMTEWTDYWLKTARNYFPSHKIYIATGGDGNPVLGADFSAQVKVASRYNAGIRITNLTDDYPRSFAVSRLVSSASRFYNTYFSTEEALVNSPKGIMMRIFDVATSGPDEVYFKGLIGLGKDVCTGQKSNIGEKTEGASNLVKNLHYLQLSQPIIELAVLFPNTSIVIDPAAILRSYHLCGQMRNLVDFDLIDENMISDDALDRYRFLVVLYGKYMQDSTVKKINAWVVNGGIFIASNRFGHYALDGSSNRHPVFNDKKSGIHATGKGYLLLSDLSMCHGRKFLRFIANSLSNHNDEYPWKGIPHVKSEWDGVYVGRLADRILYYDSNKSTIWDEPL